MQLTRSQLREKIMTILYQISVYDAQKTTYEIEDVIKENMEIENEFIKEVVYGVITHENEIIEKANENLKACSIDRLDKTGQAILKIAIYELTYTETPEVVVINEAVELAKKYSDDRVRKMINAVLDRMINE
ncbi:MAG: transcription antitermination factor NusB [Mollicutes bacterium]|nr:transcription antitermination factor NusB [Mollicutes bacterium]